MRGLEHGMPGEVIDVSARGDTDAADLSSKGVGEVVAVEIHRGDNVEFIRAR